jgi:hypothetical protein
MRSDKGSRSVKHLLCVSAALLLLVIFLDPPSPVSGTGESALPSCVHVVESGALVYANGTAVNPDNTKVQINQPCDKSLATPPTTNGWVEDGNWYSSAAVYTDWAYWVVPSGTPQGCFWIGSTLIYMFNALENTYSGNDIIQPVLQFGWNSAISGGCNWMIAAWFGANGNYVHSSYINVNPGDTIYGYMNYVGYWQGSNFWWYVQISDVTTSQTTYFLVQNPLYTYQHWAFGGALEAYNINNCNQYPSGSSGSTSFTGQSLYNGNGQQLTPSWTKTINPVSPSCSFSVGYSASYVTLGY